jgi:uncharacterized membrane protein
MSVFDYFIGSEQSKYASIAIGLAIFFICMAILFTYTEVPFINRLGVVGFVILVCIFPVALSLFELTCIVTGGKGTNVNLCSYYAWFITIIIIIYSFVLILVVISSMFTYKKAYDKITVTEAFNKVSPDEANDIAKDMLGTSDDEKKKDPFENASADATSTGSLLPVAPVPAVPTVPTVPTVPAATATAPAVGNALSGFSSSDKFMPY